MRFKNDFILLLLRVMLACLLSYAFEMYLMNYTRVFVHSYAFIGSAYLLALNVVLFSYRIGLKNKIGLALLLLYALIIAYLFIDAAWVRYNGGINKTNSDIFFVLLSLNLLHGCIFILSFFENYLCKMQK